MTSVIVEAVFFADCGEFCEVGSILELGFGVVKLGDLVSDVFFVNELSQLDDFFTEDDFEEDSNFFLFNLAFPLGVLFTVIGFLYDLVKLGALLKHRYGGGNHDYGEDNQEHTSKRRKKSGWENTNFCFEELPQFILIFAVIAALDDLPCKTILDDDEVVEEDLCTEDQRDYINDLERDATVSLVFTALASAKQVFVCIQLIRNRNCGSGDEDIDEPGHDPTLPPGDTDSPPPSHAVEDVDKQSPTVVTTATQETTESPVIQRTVIVTPPNSPPQVVNVETINTPVLHRTVLVTPPHSPPVFNVGATTNQNDQNTQTTASSPVIRRTIEVIPPPKAPPPPLGIIEENRDAGWTTQKTAQWRETHVRESLSHSGAGSSPRNGRRPSHDDTETVRPHEMSRRPTPDLFPIKENSEQESTTRHRREDSDTIVQPGVSAGIYHKTLFHTGTPPTSPPIVKRTIVNKAPMSGAHEWRHVGDETASSPRGNTNTMGHHRGPSFEDDTGVMRPQQTRVIRKAVTKHMASNR